jgi:hypothetical protein
VISYSLVRNKQLIMKKRTKSTGQFHAVISILCLLILANSCKKIEFEKLHENIKYVHTIKEAQDLLKETLDSLDNLYPYLIITTALYSDEAVYNGSNSMWAQFKNHEIDPNNDMLLLLCGTWRILRKDLLNGIIL